MSTSTPPWQPRVDSTQYERETAFATRWLWVVAVVGVLALAGALVPDRPGRVLASVAVAVVIAMPLVRVVWLIVQWSRQRDRRFVVAGLVLLGVVAAGVVAAALRGG